MAAQRLSTLAHLSFQSWCSLVLAQPASTLSWSWTWTKIPETAWADCTLPRITPLLTLQEGTLRRRGLLTLSDHEVSQSDHVPLPPSPALPYFSSLPRPLSSRPPSLSLPPPKPLSPPTSSTTKPQVFQPEIDHARARGSGGPNSHMGVG